MSDPKHKARQHTTQLLGLLRGKVKASELTELPSPPAGAPRTAVRDKRPTAAQNVRPPKNSLLAVGEHLRQHKGHLARLLAQADQLAEINQVLRAYLPPHLHDHATIATLDDPKGWIVHTDSSAWATRLRYILPNLRPQLAAHLKMEIPPLRIRVKKTAANVSPPPPSRRMTVTQETVTTLEGAARDLSDRNLGSVMMRLAEHARQNAA